jgi:hypothetical protein
MFFNLIQSCGRFLFINKVKKEFRQLTDVDYELFMSEKGWRSKMSVIFFIFGEEKFNVGFSHLRTMLATKKLNEKEFVSYEEVIKLLNDCNLLCHYCNCEVYILYEIVREMKQWSLDRINNDIGHNSGNLVVACLECNLKRRRTNKDAFLFTKNLTIIREGIDK